jgi:hypothetical protein
MAATHDSSNNAKNGNTTTPSGVECLETSHISPWEPRSGDRYGATFDLTEFAEVSERLENFLSK